MKSICIVVQSVYDFDPRVRRKAEALVAAGYSVDVLALRPEGAERTYVLNGVTVYTLALGKKRGSLARYLYEYAAFFAWVFVRVPLLMKRRHYAAIDVNTLPDFLVFAPVIARWMGAKLILDMHEITPEFYMSKYGIGETALLIRLLKYLERLSVAFADRVITINEPINELLIGRGLDRRKSIVVMNAVDEMRFTAADRSTEVGGSSSPFVMMYHGTLTRIYGLDLAVEALGMALDQMPGAELWILGSGSERAGLEAAVRARGLEGSVKFIGQIASTEIPQWLARCDLGLLPIRRDVFLDFAFPNKLPEFIIARKPVLISRLNAIRHYFSENAVLFFQPNDASDLAKQMIRIYHDRPLRDRLVLTALEEYAPIRWALMKRRYLDLIDELTGWTSLGSEPADAARTVAAR